MHGLVYLYKKNLQQNSEIIDQDRSDQSTMAKDLVQANKRPGTITKKTYILGNGVEFALVVWALLYQSIK